MRRPRGARRATLAALILLVACLVAPLPLRAQPADVDVLVAEAILAVADKEWDKALELLRRAGAKSLEKPTPQISAVSTPRTT